MSVIGRSLASGEAVRFEAERVYRRLRSRRHHAPAARIAGGVRPARPDAGLAVLPAAAAALARRAGAASRSAAHARSALPGAAPSGGRPAQRAPPGLRLQRSVRGALRSPAGTARARRAPRGRRPALPHAGDPGLSPLGAVAVDAGLAAARRRDRKAGARGAAQPAHAADLAACRPASCCATRRICAPCPWLRCSRSRRRAGAFTAAAAFPMRASPAAFESDLLGRPHGFTRVHAVDATVFPTIPSTTITFTVMANAHRIASLDA